MTPRADSLPAHRARLAAVLRAAKEVVSVDIAARTLGIKRRSATKLLSRWKGQGWLRRVGHGLCRSRLTQGYTRLDPALPPKKLVTSWRLWLPSATKQAAQ